MSRRHSRKIDSELNTKIAVGQAVYDRRTARGLSQSELARRAGTTQTVISRIEGGAVTPTLALLRKLSVGLHAALDLHLEAEQMDVKFAATA